MEICFSNVRSDQVFVFFKTVCFSVIVSSEMVEPETVDLIQPVSEPIPSTSSGRDTQAVPPAAKRTRDETEG